MLYKYSMNSKIFICGHHICSKQAEEYQPCPKAVRDMETLKIIYLKAGIKGQKIVAHRISSFVFT